MSDRPWFKMWSEARSDPKFVAVACDNQIEVVTAFGIWTMLLCIASEAPVRGTLVSASGRNYSIQELDVIVGFKGNMGTGDLSSVMESFESLDMIDKDEFGAYRIKHFEERQETREERIDRLNRERQKRYRETHKQTANVISNVTNNDDITQDSDSDSDSFNTINNTMSLNKTLNAGAEKKVMYTMMNAEGVYCRVTGLAGVTPDKMPYMEIILGMLNKHGEAVTVEKLGNSLNEWTSHVAKNGKPYSKLNPKWIELADADETVGVKAEDKMERAYRELEELSKRNPYGR